MPRASSLRTLLALALTLSCAVSANANVSGECSKTVYLTIDTGSMSQAQTISDILKRQDIKATFFLANERTVKPGKSLEADWGDFWRERVKEGHHFGSHTWRHGKFVSDSGDKVRYLPQYDTTSTHGELLDATGVCAELKKVDDTFKALTGRALDPIWRAPGGLTTPNTLKFAEACGYRHVAWAPAGFLGDELPSDKFPNALLRTRALTSIRDGDILMMHTGIWSRREAFAPELEPLVVGLKNQGFCFATLPSDRPTHPVLGSSRNGY